MIIAQLHQCLLLTTQVQSWISLSFRLKSAQKNDCSGRFCLHSKVNVDILGSLSALEVFLVDFWAFGNRWRDKVSWGHFSWRDREDSCLGLVWIFTATPLLWDRGEGSSKSSNRIMPPFMAVTLPAWNLFKMQFKFKLWWCLIDKKVSQSKEIGNELYLHLNLYFCICICICIWGGGCPHNRLHKRREEDSL